MGNDLPDSDPFRRNDRGCRCPSDRDDEISRRGLPEGYCGLCEVCGRGGHRRAFPGFAPFRGTWCDRHWEQLRRLHPFGAVGVLLWTFVAWSALLILLALSI